MSTESKQGAPLDLEDAAEWLDGILADVVSLRDEDYTEPVMVSVGRLRAFRSALSEVERLEAENAALRAQGWRSMESAPQDGTPAIVAVKMAGGPIVVGEARFLPRAHGGDDQWWWAQVDPSDYYGSAIGGEVYAWDPLPSPPESDARLSEEVSREG